MKEKYILLKLIFLAALLSCSTSNESKLISSSQHLDYSELSLEQRNSMRIQKRASKQIIFNLDKKIDSHCYHIDKLEKNLLLEFINPSAESVELAGSWSIDFFNSEGLKLKSKAYTKPIYLDRSESKTELASIFNLPNGFSYCRLRYDPN